MTLPAIPDPAADRERERRNPDRDTLELAAAGAAKVLGPDHSATSPSGLSQGPYSDQTRSPRPRCPMAGLRLA